MKAAFVLGLAVAANAQVDNEFVGYNPSGANLVRNAGWGNSHNGGIRTPIDYNTQYLNKYGLKHDATDDEMMVFYTKDSNGVRHYTGASSTYPIHRDDATDDEMMVFYTKDSNGVRHYTGTSSTYPYPTRRFDATDDEMMVFYTKDSNGVRHYTGASSTYPIRRDDATDDEMMVYYTKDSRGVKHYIPTPSYTRRDDSADDELAELVKLLVEYKVHERKPLIKRRDDSTDDELVTLPYHPSGADLVKYAKQSQQTVYRPTAHVVRDDEADDELALLGHLIKETQPEKVEKKTHEKTRKFRPVEKN